ncbi:peptidoglycan-recognition protein SC2-like [Rhinophrynus dorsalis]
MLRLIALLAAFCAVAHGCPTILTKSQWGGRAPTCQTTMATPVTYVIIHHTAGSSCTTQSTCITQVKNIQNYHMNTNGYCDISYSFLVGEDGNVYEGRGWTTVGAHTPNVSTPSIGISVIGNFMSRNPNTAAQNAVKSLISCGVTKGYIKAAYILKGHRNVTATDCPGNTFYSTITTWPRFQA